MHPPDNDLVIAAGVNVFGAALKARRVFREYWHSMQSGAAIEAAEFVIAALRKAVAQLSLVPGKDMHGKMVCAEENLVAHRLEADAPENQRRIQRNRVEAADGDADLFALIIDRRYNRDPGRKMTEGTPKLLTLRMCLARFVQPS